ncbi:MAG: tRNA pseudouridine(38-40) synthase TruA [Planctomycetota bacterium]
MSMSRKLKLIVAYDGTDFHGWQHQPGLRSVQQELTQVIARVLRHPLDLTGASRTDSGVHARGQTAHLLTEALIPVEKLQHALRDRLPPDLTIVHVAEVPREFHATRDAYGKLYRYTIFNARHRPIDQQAGRYCWHVWHPLDIERMQAAAEYLIGSHDFTAFANKGNPRQSPIRTINHISVQRRARQVVIEVEGDGFLYNQVRIIVGTLYEVGRGHWAPERVAEILAARDRAQAGMTAPPQGLSLEWVRYGPYRRAADGA